MHHFLGRMKKESLAVKRARSHPLAGKIIYLKDVETYRPGISLKNAFNKQQNL
jgi:hypothetical protein